MPNNKYDYTVKIGADIKNLKKDIKSELASVLREVDNVGDAVSKGITPDTKDFESKIASLESKMEKLTQSSKNIEQQVSSMKTAFKGFTELEASMKVIGEQNKVMYDTFVKMTPYLHEFAKTFTAMKPEQAGAAFASVMQNMSASGNAGTKAFKDVQNAAQQAANVTKKSFHEVETVAVNGATAINGVVETTGQSINNIKQETKEAVKELERLQDIRKSYSSSKDYNGTQGQSSLRKEIDAQRDAFRDSQGIFEEALESGENYNKELIDAIENGQKLLSLLDKLDESNLSSKKYKENYKNAAETDVKNYIKQYENLFSAVSAEISKVELKPLRLKVDIANDDEIIEQINKALERIKDNVKINPIKIPLNFISQETTEEIDKQVKKTKKKRKTTEEINIDAVKSSFDKEIENIKKSFEQIKQPLLNEVKEWRNNLEEYLTLQFKWRKGDKEGIIALFDDINHYAETNPIWLNPDTDKLISEIESALTQHQFNLNLKGATNISGNLSSAIPVAIVGGAGTYQAPAAQRTIRQSGSASNSTIKAETKKETTSVDVNSKAVEKNSDVILDVVNEFKTYSKSGNETIKNAEKTIQKLLTQNEKLDKNNPQDAEKITENNAKIKKAKKKISDQEDRFSALRSRTDVDVQNISSIDDKTLYKAIKHLVENRNEIVDALNTTKIGGASNSKTFLTKGVKDLVDSISNAQQMLNVEMKESETVSKELAAKDYLKDAEQLTRMGMSLKTANREIRNNIVPTGESLQQVIDIFSGTGEGRYKSRNMTAVTQSAKNLKDVLGQYDELLSVDGGYQQYVNRLNDEIAQIQSEIDELSKHPRKNKAAIAEKKGQLGVKEYELSEIRQNVEPILNNFKESIKGLPGQIADQLKGYKFIVEFIDADGKKVTESFNDASARAPQNTEPYYKRATKMFDRINAGEITSITPKSTPNDSAITMLYGDKLSKTNAVQKVIDAYDSLDDQARKFVDTLIDINKLTNENISVSQKWEHIEESGLLDRNNSGQIGRSLYANNKFKKNQTMDNFLNEVVEAYFGVTANGRLRASTQKMLMRGATISYGSSKNAAVAHPEEYAYGYGTSNRAYRTAYDGESKTIDEYNTELASVNDKLSETSTRLDNYNEQLQQASAIQKEQRAKFDDTAERKSLREQYTNVTDQASFSKEYAISEQNTKISKDIVNDLQTKVNKEQKNLNKLSSELQETEQAISVIQSRIQDVSVAGGVQQYLDQLNQGISEFQTLEQQIGASEKQLIEDLRSIKSLYDRGEVSQEEYEIQKRETDEVIAENNEILKAEREKYTKLLEIRDAFAAEIQMRDKTTGEVRQVTDDEYFARQKEEITKRQAISGNIQQNINESETRLAQVNSELASAQSQYGAQEQNLQQMRYAFAEEYYEYITTQLNITNKELENVKKLKTNANAEYVDAETKVNSTKTGIEVSEGLYNKATTEKNKKKYQEQIEQLKVSHEQAKKVFEVAKANKEEIERKYEELNSYKSYLTSEESKTSNVLHPNITTDKDGEVGRLRKLIAQSKEELSILEDRKTKIEQKIYNIQNGVVETKPETPVEAGSEQAKIYALREIESIDADLELADKKIEAATQKKKELENRIKVLQKKGTAAQEVKQSQNQATGYAVQTAKNSDEYKEFQRDLHEQFKSGAITWDEYSTKIQDKIDEIVAKLKEAEPDKYTGKSAEELEASLNKEKKTYQNDIKEAKAKKKDLQAQRQEAIAFAQLSEEELATQRAITEEKKEQVAATQQEATIQTQQTAEHHIDEQSSQVDTARIQELDSKIAANDEKIAQLQSEIKSDSKKKKSTKATKKLTDKQQSKINEQFQDYVSQIKAKEISKGVSVKDVDLSEAINMQKQLNTLAEQGNQNTEEYLTLQRQLSELISKRTNQLKGTGRNGYATSNEKYDWLKSNVSEDVANFYSSDQYAAQAGKFDIAVAKTLGSSLVEGFSDEFKVQCVAAAKQASADVKSQGGTSKEAKKAAMQVVQKLIDSIEQGVEEGVKQETAESTSDIASKKAEVKKLTAQNAQYKAEKEQLIEQGTTSYYSPTPLSTDQMAVQAGTVIVGGSDGSGPWALETTLGKTNEILSSINSKIDSVKGGSGSGDNSSTGSGNKKSKKQKIDVDTAKDALYQAADDNLAKSFGEGTKSVRKFNEDTLKLYETLTLANGETVKFTYSINKMDGSVKSSYTTVANFEKVAKQAYAELGKNQAATKQMFDGLNFPEEKVQAYNNAITALDNKLKSLGNKGVTDPSDAVEVETLTGNVKKLRTEMESMAKASAKLANENDLVKAFDSDEIYNTKAQMEALAKEVYGAGITVNGFNAETNELTFSVKTGKDELTTLTYKFDDLTKSVYKTGQASKTTTGFFRSFFSDVGSKIGELARYYTGMSLLTEAFQQVRQGVQYVREIDIALTELKKVTDESESSYNRFLQTMSETASVVGSTVSELTNSAAAWARLGFTMEEAGELAKNTAILLNVSEFESEEQATEALISSLQAFNYEASESIKIVDKLNIVGNNFAISSDGIAEGLSRSASTLVAAGNSLEESIAMLAAGNKVQQDPEGLGNALKVLSMRIRGTKTELEEAGEETDGMIENTSKLRDKVMALTDVGDGGVDILTDTGAYKSTYQILLEIAEVWDRINETDPMNQAALLEILAGKTRGSQVASILQNPEDLKDAYEMALNSDGSAQQELDTYLDSIQGRIDIFTNAVQTLWVDIISSDFIKWVVDAGTTLVNILDEIVNKIGVLGTAIAGLGIKQLFKSFMAKNELKSIFDIFDFVKNLAPVQNILKTLSVDLAAIQMGATAASSGLTGFSKIIAGLKGGLSTLIAGINPVVAGIVAVVAVVAILYDALTTSHKEYLKQFEETSKELDDIKSNLKSLNSELETTKERIEELEGKGSNITLTEAEELEKLRAQNDELERQIQLEEAREERARNRQAEQAAGLFDTDSDFKAQTVVNADGSVSVTNEFENKLSDIEKAKEEMENTEIALQDAINSGMDTESKKFKKLEEDLYSAQEDYTEAYSNWDEFIQDKETEYDGLEWFDGEDLTEAQKKVNQILSTFENYNDKAEIMFGSAGAKESALNRIFGKRGSEAGKTFLEEFNAQVESGSINLDASAIDTTTNSVKALIDKNPQLQLQLDNLGISAEDVARHFSNIDDVIHQTNTTVSVAVTDIASLTSAYESYASALDMANEAIYEGQAISDEYYESLKEYLGDVTVGEEDFSDAIDTSNGNIIKNAKLLKDLIGQKKKEQKATVNAAKAQSQLQYAKVVKQLQQAVKAMALDYKAYGYVTQATYDNISALRSQIQAIKNAIREYVTLELKLSDVTNAYDEFEDAKNRDAELTYGDSLIESIQALNDGFATGQVGTETFKAAVDLIVPPEAYEGLDDYQDKLIAIHNYVDKNKLFADWFTVDDDGNFSIEFKNMAAFVQDMQNMDVFSGDDVTGFNFTEEISSLGTTEEKMDAIVQKTKEFNGGIGVTKETLVAMLTELSKYDARWGDLLSELTMTSADIALRDTATALDGAIAKQEQFFKDGKDPYSGDSATEYDEIQQEINKCSDAYDAAQKAIINNTNAWVDANNKVDAAKNKVADLSKELQNLKDSNTDETEIQIKTNELEEAKKELSEALQIKYSLGEEPTQIDFQLVLDNVQEQIDKWKVENATLDVDVVPKLEQNEDGTWKIPAEIEADLSDDDKKKIQEYVDLINDEQGLATLLGLVETDPAVDKLTEIKDVVSEISKKLGVDNSTSESTVKSTELRENKSATVPEANSTSSDSESTNTSSSVGFDTEAIDIQIAAANEFLKELGEQINEFASGTKEALVRFFTETLPQKWSEFWDSVGEKIDEAVVWAQDVGSSIKTFFDEKSDAISAWAEEMGESAGSFFTETLPQKWHEFWGWVGLELNNLKEWAKKLGDSASTFFTETLPEKWDEFWSSVGECFRSIPYTIFYFINKVRIFFKETLPAKWYEFWSAVGEEFNKFKQWASDLGDSIHDFFTDTLPKKWDEFWKEVGSALNNIKNNAIALKDDVVEFFQVTIPTKWHEFWSRVSDYISTNITPALNACWNKIVEFFTVTIPTKWTAFWDSVNSFITETVPVALNAAWAKVVEFFQVTIPDKWNGFWDSVSDYISTNITPALTAFWNKIVEFFTTTLPEKWTTFWNDVSTFITETVPTALGNVKEDITTFFTVTIPEKINGLWSDIASWVTEKANSVWDFITGEWARAKEDATKGTYSPTGSAEATGNALAKGNAHSKSDVGLKSNEHDAIVGELGRELVVDVDKGVYYTVGENGTERVNLPKHAIIYNHKQTEELLKNGKTSRGKYTGGLSFAKGNAHYSDGYNHGLFGGYLSDDAVFKDTSRQWVEANKNWVNDFANASDGIVDAADSLSDSADTISDAFEDAINWIDVLFTRIENNISEQEAFLETIIDTAGVKSIKDSVYNSIYGQLYSKANYSLEAANYYRAKAESEMAGLPADIQNKIRNGAIQIQDFVGTGDEDSDDALQEYVDKINQAIEYYDKISEYEQQYWTTITEIADKAVEHQEDVAQGYENEIGLVEHLNNTLEARNDLQEAKEGFATEAYYKAQISASNEMLSQYKAQRKAMQDVFDTEVKLGRVKVGSQQWFDMQQAIYEVDDAIIDTMSSIEDLQNSINDLHWARFDELINRFEYLEDEIGNIVQLLSHDSDGLIMEELRDLTSDDWATDSGLATIGLYAQEMERAQYVANEYAEAINNLQSDYAAGRYNETEYLSKLNELISAQYENIEKYYDAKDAIVELNSTRVDAIKDGIQKEIDAYEELINKKKDLLDSEQSLHDFQDEIAEKEKTVSDIRKQLTAMAGDDTAATTARRKQLEAELVEAQKALDESYYSHSMTSRQEALDQEFADFEDQKNAEMDKWDEWLENTETVVSESLSYVKSSTEEVFTTLTDLGSQYNLTMSDSLTQPWSIGESAIDSYSTNFETAMSAFTSQLDQLVLNWDKVTAAAEEAAAAQVKALQAEYKKTTTAVSSATKNATTTTTTTAQPTNTTKTTANTNTAKAITVGGKINAGSAKIYSYAGSTTGYKQYYSSDPVYTVLQEKNGYVLARYHKLSSGYTGWFKKADVKAYASGTLGTNKDELALIDELGDELVVHAQNGRLSYLSKGTGVVPADLTEKIVDLALDPTSALEDAMPKTKIPNITTNSFDTNLSFDSLVHVDNCSKDTVPELQKMVRKEFNNMLAQVNNGLKRTGKS